LKPHSHCVYVTEDHEIASLRADFWRLIGYANLYIDGRTMDTLNGTESHAPLSANYRCETRLRQLSLSADGRLRSDDG
jgi:hypothetical protein